MLLSLAWLKEFVPYEGTAAELGAKLTMLGLELENIIEPYKAIEPIVIGYVKECNKHPEADKLSVCSVDIGAEELLQIVCGAPNVGAGQYVPVATVGTTMPEGLKIKKAKLRNVESSGMICSERELKLSEDHKGIMVLNDILPQDKLVVGAKLVDALNLDKEVLEIGITPNRSDCLSVLGFAREVALAFDLPLTMPKCELKVEDTPVELKLDVDASLSPYYTGRILDNPKVGESPAWVKYRLNAVGVRAISNVVDATNYVLMELGIPLHSFDKAAIEGDTVCVVSAKDGDKYTTLDSQERALKENDILIADKTKTIGLGGVMGGLNSETTESTTSIFLEAAVFNPSLIRKTARRLALSSEASYRFERGVDPEMVDIARDRCAYLIQELTGASCRSTVLKTEKTTAQAQTIAFSYPRCIDLLGIEISREFCENTFMGLGCKIEKSNEDNWSVTAPTWRADLSRQADLAEEVIRCYGVDNIIETFPPVLKDLQQCGKLETRHPFLVRLRHFMAGMGLNECVCYSFVGHEDLDRLNIAKEHRVGIANPLSADQNVLRTDLVPGLLNALKVNMGQGNTSLKLFELAQSFVQDPKSETTVHETRRMGILLTGERYSHFPHPSYSEDLFEYADLKGIVETFFHNFLNLPLPQMEKVSNHPYMSPAVKITLGGSPLSDAGDVVAVMGRIKPEIADHYNAREHVWYAEINLCALRGLAAKNTIQFKSLPVYPPVRRDITVIAPRSLAMKDIVDTLKNAKTKLLENVELHDLYLPSKDSEEHNLTFRLTFRSAEKTLVDADVDKEREKLVKTLTEKLSVRV